MLSYSKTGKMHHHLTMTAIVSPYLILLHVLHVSVHLIPSLFLNSSCAFNSHLNDFEFSTGPFYGLWHMDYVYFPCEITLGLISIVNQVYEM